MLVITGTSTRRQSSLSLAADHRLTVWLRCHAITCLLAGLCWLTLIVAGTVATDAYGQSAAVLDVDMRQFGPLRQSSMGLKDHTASYVEPAKQPGLEAGLIRSFAYSAETSDDYVVAETGQGAFTGLPISEIGENVSTDMIVNFDSWCSTCTPIPASPFDLIQPHLGLPPIHPVPGPPVGPHPPLPSPFSRGPFHDVTVAFDPWCSSCIPVPASPVGPIQPVPGSPPIQPVPGSPIGPRPMPLPSPFARGPFDNMIRTHPQLGFESPNDERILELENFRDFNLQLRSIP